MSIKLPFHRRKLTVKILLRQLIVPLWISFIISCAGFTTELSYLHLTFPFSYRNMKLTSGEVNFILLKGGSYENKSERAKEQS
mgnify:FL=1|jgi:hypothetical protein